MAECETLICQGTGNKPVCTEGKLEIYDGGLKRALCLSGRIVVLMKQPGYKVKKGH